MDSATYKSEVEGRIYHDKGSGGSGAPATKSEPIWRTQMNIGIPQIILIAWYVLSLGVTLAKHGEPRDGKYNFLTNLIITAIVFLILWWGGFF